jgi:hypothetical protein
MLYTVHRIGEVNRAKFSSALRQTWNTKYGSNKVIGVDIVTEDEVVDMKRYVKCLKIYFIYS